jgi:Ca2+/Na+ antiporter
MAINNAAAVIGDNILNIGAPIGDQPLFPSTDTGTLFIAIVCVLIIVAIIAIVLYIRRKRELEKECIVSENELEQKEG